MDSNTLLVLVAGAAGGLSLALGQAVVGYRAVTPSDSPLISVFLVAQIIPVVGLTIVGALVAWATASEPVSSFLTGLTALGFVLVLTRGDEKKSSNG